ncbi:GPW/gp25 family protein [sulfur-oxidizing endosymbiont of Gigantopelta aegis]|uniref:GPW/gp25 family protein n=1 Tax=sulfur-oxidizing endosymbiont of Gigantopelta aegis TaxID=2794934 RepID=UPI0018DD770D|nr:GPW/gp25 family protein [sulfur-oxidizing endosymbiont of Gigantopelta aegis]
MARLTRTKINNRDYMSFPFTIEANGSTLSSKQQHIREMIEQIIFTSPGERWYRPEFGIGAMALVFEPNQAPMHELVKKRLLATLAEALKGDVLAESLEVDVRGENEQLKILISYQMAALQFTEKLEFVLNSDE